ncbi:MAG: TIR domain-containing protein [Pseudomonadota bacterium]|nr:TIR domain-containing protein [Pseudomonadota bacterium]
MPDVFISYSSKDRPVAERVQSALADEGYDVFWDQDTPAGQDWDSWIRERLQGAACVIVLWTKASIASPNVRHEAIVAREQGKLLPVMVDDLKPSDFPMGLYMVQGVVMGRSAKDFEAARDKLVGEVRNRVGAREKAARGAAAARKRWGRKHWIAAGAAAALALLLALLLPSYSVLTDANAPPVGEEAVRQAAASEGMARERVARSAETALSGDQEVIGTSWAWFAGQLVSAAPEESRSFIGLYFNYLDRVVREDCGCWHMHDIPHSIGNGWVVIAAAQFRRPAPPRLLEAILSSQHQEGWWTISFNGVRDPANAAVHATAMLTIALAEARRAGVVPQEMRPRVEAALRRASSWLSRGPEAGVDWADYPNDERRAQNLVFAAMATVATHLAGQTGPRPPAAAFIRSASELPEPTEHFPSGAYIELTNGERFIDSYRHPVSPWVGAAAVFAYPHGSLMERRRLRGIIRDWLALDLGDERLLRHDWIIGETLFLRQLAFRRLLAGE